jgi:predicted Rdx family selenoprotein
MDLASGTPMLINRAKEEKQMPSLKIYKCSKCKKWLLASGFYKNKATKRGLNSYCKICFSPHNKGLYSKMGCMKRIWFVSKTNSRRTGMIHTIEVSDIPSPEKCVYTGMILNYSPGRRKKHSEYQNTASIDRIDPRLGYIEGNIQIITMQANRMKNDATIEELINFAKGVLRTHCPEALKSTE